MHRRTLRTIVLSTIGLGACLGFAATRPEANAAGTQQGATSFSRIDGYQKWHRTSDKPKLLSDNLAILCEALTGKKLALYGVGLHRYTHALVYVNPTGEKAMSASGAAEFPTGSVIVSEKHRDEKGPVELLTVMIKEAKGSHPSTGDWAFHIADSTGHDMPLSKDLEFCGDCHAQTAKTDYVFKSKAHNEF